MSQACERVSVQETTQTARSFSQNYSAVYMYSDILCFLNLFSITFLVYQTISCEKAALQYNASINDKIHVSIYPCH